ncbi:hypothetical protein B0T10DRAFT_420073, partial [Thelonectria olida]
SAVFHFFPSLPTELRLQIWKKAIRPSENKDGLHYFSIMNKNDTVEDSIATVSCEPGLDPDYHSHYKAGISNKSVFLWDSGLWTTCTESRQVIMNHFKVEHRGENIRQLLSNDRFSSYSDWSPSRRRKELDAPARAVIQTKHHVSHWSFMVQPFLDVFCFQPHDWSLDVEWEDLFKCLPFCAMAMGYAPVLHVAFEFDLTWNLNLPEDHTDLYLEPSARGLAMRAVESVVRGVADFSIWLIDPTTRWNKQTQMQTRLAKIVYDSDGEFVEIHEEQLVCDSEEEYQKTAFYFARYLLEKDDEWFAHLTPREQTEFGRISLCAETQLGILASSKQRI